MIRTQGTDAPAQQGRTAHARWRMKKSVCIAARVRVPVCVCMRAMLSRSPSAQPTQTMRQVTRCHAGPLYVVPLS